jgi:hypothetical protein
MTGSAHPAGKKRAPARPVEVAARVEPAAAKEPDVTPPAAEATIETPAAVAMNVSAPEPVVAPLPLPQPAPLSRVEERLSARAEATRPEPRRETRAKSPHRKLADRSSGRKLQLMVLRTYQGPDGRRFSRLLSLREARNAMAFQSDW